MKAKLKWGAEFISSTQQDDGSFLGLSSPNSINFSKATAHKTTFPASLILSSLSNFQDNEIISNICSKAANFLLNQKSVNWSFNYYERHTEQGRREDFPDDFDDTFCALASLYLYNPEIFDGEAYAKISLMLTAFETQEGGPYTTWLVPQEADDVWRDVDLAVNCNIAHFLKLQDVNLPNINRLIEEAIKTNNLTSPYYSDAFPVYYFIARTYDGPMQQQLAKIILQQKKADGSFGNPIQTSFALTALLRLKVDPSILSDTYKWLLDLPKKEIAQPYSFGIDPAVDSQTYYAGSPTVTVAFYLESINLYNQLSNTSNKQELQTPIQQLDIYQQTIQIAKQKAQVAGPTLANQMEKVINQITLRDKDGQIALMPYLFNKSLGTNGLDSNNPMIADLCLANLFGWIAYTIYDDFLDDEGKPARLSLANFCLRETSVIFSSIAKRFTEFKYIWTKVMNDLDEANTKEIQNYRFKINGNKFQIPNPLPDTQKDEMRYNRSMGHALGPVAILCALNQKVPDSEIQNLLKFFQSYIAARQLNDDAHDWEDDINRGHLNETVIDLLETWQQTHNNPIIDLEKDILELQRLFWIQVIQDICAKANSHIHEAEQALKKIQLIQDKEPLAKLLNSIQASTEKALKEQTDMLAFLNVYQQS